MCRRERERGRVIIFHSHPHLVLSISLRSLSHSHTRTHDCIIMEVLLLLAGTPLFVYYEHSLFVFAIVVVVSNREIKFELNEFTVLIYRLLVVSMLFLFMLPCNNVCTQKGVESNIVSTLTDDDDA